VKIVSETVINKPIQNVWDVLGNQFGEAHKWTSILHHSEGQGKTISDQVCESRACDIKGMGRVSEKIRTFDSKNYILKYEVVEGFPFFVKNGFNTWQLKQDGNSTRVIMNAEIETKGIMGMMMSPMMKMQMTGMMGKFVEELKYYVENGKPHPRKK